LTKINTSTLITDPPVTVIIPTYNYARYIKQAIASVLTQDYSKELMEIIVVDDGSTDDTKTVLHELITNGVIDYYYQDNKGKANATHNAVQKATGKYIFNLDADDYFLPGKISKSVNIFEQDPEIVHVASPAKIFYEDTKIMVSEKLPIAITERSLDGNWLLDYFYKNNILYGGGTTYGARSSVLKAISIPGGVDMFIDEFLILAVLPFGKSYFIEEPLSVWRVHENNYSGTTATREKQLKKEKRLLDSSVAILEYLKDNQFNGEIIKLYHLKDLTRKIAFKESEGQKRLSDIFRFADEVFFSLKPGWPVIKSYYVINRLIPSRLFNLLKKIGKKKQVLGK
jgi:glycosyltransferase involved in cell wall biosynthesis